MAMLPPRVNLDAQRLDARPNTPDAHQLLVASQQQQGLELARAQAQLPQGVSALERQLDSRETQASQMAYRAKAALQALAGGPGALPGQAGVLQMAAAAPEGVDPRLAILQRLGLS